MVKLAHIGLIKSHGLVCRSAYASLLGAASNNKRCARR